MREWIVGRNPVQETLRANRREFFGLAAADNLKEDRQIAAIFKLASARSIPVKRIPREQLDQYGSHHQSLALQVGGYPYADLNQVLKAAEDREEPLFVLLLDVLKDPQNLGTLVRTAEAVGVHGVVLPYRRTATVTPAVVSASSGACEHMRIVQANLAQTISDLKEAGAWVYGLEGSTEAQSPGELDLSGPIAVVVGSEGEGMRRLVQESCDFLLALPMRGRIESLNASVAGSVALYLVWSARGYSGAGTNGGTDGGNRPAG